MLDFEEVLKLVSEQTIVCIGDLMLDDFVYGEVSRISPEAPAPILAVTRNDLTVGGAGNVARNIAGLGARCGFIGVGGEDEASRTLLRALAAEPLIEPHLVVDPARPTTRKVRFVSEHHSTHLLRADWELPEVLNARTEKALIDRALAALPRASSVVLSDYAKGALTPHAIREIIDAAKKAGVPIIVDPKVADYSIYRGATVIKPNRKELSDATRRRVDTDDDVIAAASELNRLLGTDAVVVSLSDAGLILVPSAGAALHVPAYPVKVRDTSGAGDTVVATLAVMLAIEVDHETAVRAANAAAAVVVGKRGTATVSSAELRSRVLPAASLAPEEKIVFDWAVLDERLAEWRGLRIGFTNGCFDLLHPGHIKLLSETSARGEDRLRLGGARRTARRMAGIAHRLHQRVLRSSSSRPYQAIVGDSRQVRPPHRRPQQRCVRAAIERRGETGAADPCARRGAGGAAGGRPCRHIRSRHAARIDPPRAAEDPGQRWRLPTRGRRGSCVGRGGRRPSDPHRPRTRLQHHHDRPSIACAPIELVPADRAENGYTNDRARGTRAGARAGGFRRRAIRLLRRGRGQPTAAGITDLAPRAARLERHPYRAAARPCRRTAPRPLGQGGRGRLFITCERWPADASPRRRGIVVARSRSDGARGATRTDHRGAHQDARRHPRCSRGACSV